MGDTKRGDYAGHWDHVKNLKYLIQASPDFIVFIDQEDDVDWETSPAYDQSGHKDATKHHAIMNTQAILETTPCQGLRADTRLHFKRLIGEAVVRSLEHDYVSATRMLASAKSYITARSEETSRFWYLSSCFVATLPFLVIGACIWFWRGAVIGAVGDLAMWIMLSAVAGTMGALLSVIARTGKLKFDCSSGRKLHYLEGGSRICAGLLSGVVVALAIRSEMFLAPLSRGDKLHSVMLIAAFAAGAVERLATSIISAVGAEHVRLPKTRVEPSENADGD
jgi:hypothetical protein